MKPRAFLLALILIAAMVLPPAVQAQTSGPAPHFAPATLSSHPTVAAAKLPALRSPQVRKAVETQAGKQAPASAVLPQGEISAQHSSDLEYLAGWSKLTYSLYLYNWEIFIFNGDETNPIQLTKNGFADIEPRLNRGATSILFLSNRDGTFNIYRMDSDGKNVQQLSFAKNCTVETPDWSPDGNSVLFMSSCSGRWQMYQMNADGSNLQSLVYDGYQVLYPTWGPDGSQVAFLRFADASTTTADLVTMDVVTGNIDVIATLQNSPSDLSWSPDGRWIAVAYENGEGVSMMVISPKNPNQQRYIEGNSQDPAWYIPYGWSPDGWMITYDRYIWTTNPDNTSSLLTIFANCASLEYGAGYCSGAYGDIPSVNRDWATLDFIPPIGHLDPLPKYSRPPFKVSWNGSDLGGSGFVQTQVQYKVNDGPWTSWAWYPFYTYNDFTPSVQIVQPGDVVSFRGRAMDRSLNWSEWFEREDTSTRIYKNELSGQVLDNRDQPVFNAKVTIDPVGWEVEGAGTDGSYSAHTLQIGKHRAEAAHPGYASTDPITLDLSKDINRNFYLSPQKSLVNNGGFENGLDGWQAEGELPSSIGTSPYSGAGNLNLGLDCPAPCIFPREVISSGRVSEPHLQVDSLGQPHILFIKVIVDYKEYGLYETVRSAVDGSWTTDLIENCGSCDYDHLAFGIDGEGNAYAARARNQDIQFYTRPAGGSWSAPVVAATGNYQSNGVVLEASKDGWVYLLYTTQATQESDLRLVRRSPEGNWSDSIELTPKQSRFAVVAGNDNLLHVFLSQGIQQGAIKIYHQIVSTDGTSGERELICEPNNIVNTLHPIAYEDGRLTLFWEWGDNYYSEYQPGSGWTAPAYFDTGTYTIKEVMKTPDGWLHAVTYDNAYYSRSPEREWTYVGKVDLDRAMAADALNRLHFLGSSPGWNDLFYGATTQLIGVNSADAAQIVSIPADMKNPTLSFLYTLAGKIDIPGSRLKVSVEEDGQEPVELLNSGQQAAWKHVWFDAAPWAGKTVTLRVHMDQSEGETAALARLDDISLGSFTTPKITSVVPVSRLRPLSGDWVIRITGENFDQPVFLLDRDEYQPVQIDDQTFEIAIPQNVKLGGGYHSITAVNADGSEAFLAEAVFVNPGLFFPLIFGRTK